LFVNQLWKGKIASQIDNNPKSETFGQYLSGGEDQLVIDFKQAENLGFAKKINDPKITERKPTNWDDSHLTYNVPEKDVSVQLLKAEEIVPKSNSKKATVSK
jgi:hypothetical protein